MPIPDLDRTTGNLPPGVHDATWDELVAVFGSSSRREELLDGLLEALSALRAAGCARAYIDGSFVTAKDSPGDFDGCWEASRVDAGLLDPVLLDFTHPRTAQKAKFGGELFIANSAADPAGRGVPRLLPDRQDNGPAQGHRRDRSRGSPMIANERQHKIATAEIKRFEEAIGQAQADGPTADVDPRIHNAMIAGMNSQRQDLREQVRDYRALRAGKVKGRILHSIRELPDALIEGRIARRFTQKQLGQKLGIPEQQIQRYEQTHYSGASIERLGEVADALQLTIRKKIE